MKITLFTKIDYAGSGRKLHDAISRYTDHDIEFYSERAKNKYNIPRGGIAMDGLPSGFLQDRIDASDIIHLKSDWPSSVYEARYKIRLSHKPIVQTVSSGLFRKRDPIAGVGKGRYKPDHYKHCVLRTSFEPDLLYPEYDGILTPYPIDSMDKSIEWKMAYPPVFTHHPTSERSKRTPFIRTVLERFPEADVRIKRGKVRVQQAESIRQRMESTIFFDQFAVGAYGNAACEVMQYGIPVCAWISPQAFSFMPDWYREECPVITTDNIVVEEWVDLIKKTMEGDMWQLAVDTKRWCDKYHSYQAVAKQWDELYKSI